MNPIPSLFSAQPVARDIRMKFVLPRVFALSWPLIVSNITVPMLGLVDTAVLGHLPNSQYIGAVALGASLFGFLFWAFGFLRMGTTGLTAQAYGRARYDDVALLLARSLVFALAMGLILIAAGPIIIPFGLDLLGGSKGVTQFASTYAAIRILSAPAVLSNYALVGWFLGRQNSRITLLLVLVTNSVNIALDLTFVLIFNMTVAGVAWASVIASYGAAAVGLYLAYRACKGDGATVALQALKKWADYKELFIVNSALFVRTLGMLFATAFFNAQGALQGDVILAANAVLVQFILLAAFAMDGFAHSSESLIGEAVGRRSVARLRAYRRGATICCVASALLISLSYILFGHYLVLMLTDIDAVIAKTKIYMPWVWAIPILSVWAYLYDGLFIGLTRTKAMRNTVLIAVLGVYLPVWYFSQGWGNHGLWLAFSLYYLARGIGLAVTYAIWPGWDDKTVSQ